MILDSWSASTLYFPRRHSASNSSVCTNPILSVLADKVQASWFSLICWYMQLLWHCWISTELWSPCYLLQSTGEQEMLLAILSSLYGENPSKWTIVCLSVACPPRLPTLNWRHLCLSLKLLSWVSVGPSYIGTFLIHPSESLTASLVNIRLALNFNAGLLASQRFFWSHWVYH